MTTQVRDGEGVLTTSPNLPADRIFRDAWKDDGSTALVLDVDLMKPIARDLVNEWRETADQSPIIAEGRTFSADEISRSQRNITGAALMAVIAVLTESPYSVDWTDNNNERVPLDGGSVMGLGATLATRTSFLYSKARDIKDAINAATEAGLIIDQLSLLLPGAILIPFNPGNP